MTVALFPLLLFAVAGVEVITPDSGSPEDAGTATTAHAPAPSPARPAIMPAIVPAPGEGPAARQHRSKEPDRRGTHELRDPADWPSEPAAPAPLDQARFEAAVVALCDEVAPRAGLDDIARLVRQVGAETRSDPFLLAALVYRQSRCRPGLESSGGVGLLQIEPAMFGPRAALPVAREDLARDRLLEPEHNLRVGAALLEMWQATHVALDAAVGSTPHRTAVSHLVWGDHVWSASAEDRVLVARRRLLEIYGDGTEELSATSYAGLVIVPPLTGGKRLGTSGPGADRDGGKREHRGIDVDASVGEPVHAVADGVVQFAGADMPGSSAARDLAPRQLRRWRYRPMGPGGFFVRVVHDGGVRTGYFHLHTYNVVAGQAVKAGEVIGTVGLTGVKASASHLHFEVHQDGELGDPVRFLEAYVLSPERTISHGLAMAEKRERLARARRARRHRVT